MSAERIVYVISDLHIGGIYATKNAPHELRQRDFRMMTHVAELSSFIGHITRLPKDPPVELVINGDFIDFLAEEKGSGSQDLDLTRAPTWTPFRIKRGEALDAFREVVRRDEPLFTALKNLLAAGKKLTIVLGNHDIELCLPDVRAALEQELGPGNLRFLDDGQAYDLGEVLIDHGNLFDPANVVDHDQLRVVRSLYSRGWFENLEKVFSPPAGSKLVADVMNPIKSSYGFIDLLKPESEPLFALLLAIEPSYRGILDETAAALAGAAKTLVPRRGVTYTLRNASGGGTGGGGAGLRNASGSKTQQSSALDAIIAETLTAHPEVVPSLQQAGKGQAGQANVAGGARARWSLLRLLLGEEEGDVLERIPQVQATLRVLEGEQSFVRGSENARYLDAAKWLASQGKNQKGYKAVIFGHTHHAKALTIPDTKASYFNTGTWANLMTFPPLFTDPTATPQEIKAELIGFAMQLQRNELKDHIVFEPTYVRLELGPGGSLIEAKLHDFDWENDKL